MNRYMRVGVACLSVALAYGGGTTTVSAQQSIDIVGAIRFYSPQIAEPQPLFYGVGSDYTNSTDKGKEQLIPPFPPPGNSYLVYLDRECGVEDGDPPCWWRSDLRAVPDSVESGEVQRFEVQYRIGVENNTGQPLMLSILNPDWPEGVDSMHVVDAQLASAFDHTFTGPVEVEISDILTKYLDVTVYYNLTTSSVRLGSSSDRAASTMTVLSNPVVSGTTMIRSDFNQGDVIEIVSVHGEVVYSSVVESNTSEQRLDLSGLPAGQYVVVRKEGGGQAVAGTKLTIVR